MKTLSELIYVNPNALDEEVCNTIIERFKKDKRKMQGITSSGKVELKYKKSIDLAITGIDGWQDIDAILYNSLNENVVKYATKLKNIIDIPLWNMRTMQDDGYNVKEYKPGDYYNWHVDSLTYNDGWTRVIACIWYLNKVEKGGETKFVSGNKVTPSTGKLILFPSTWNFPHKGTSPIKGNKYIITSFLLTKGEGMSKLNFDLPNK
tara:strand:- start:2137 stop:2754 length:618 start_codon:yes stop_codon:yes gene_type:complete